MCQGEVNSVTNGDIDSDLEQIVLQRDESKYHNDLSVNKISKPDTEQLAPYQEPFHWREWS